MKRYAIDDGIPTLAVALRAAHFFTLVSRDTREEEFAHHRKLFLTEQGYSYHVRLADATVAHSR